MRKTIIAVVLLLAIGVLGCQTSENNTYILAGNPAVSASGNLTVNNCLIWGNASHALCYEALP